MLTSLTLSFALLTAALTEPAPNDLSTLPADQQTVARCMLSSAKANPRVSNARIAVRLIAGSGAGAVSKRVVVLNYDYIQVIPELKRQERTTEVEITPYLTAETYAAAPVIVWEGIAPKPAPPGYFSDSHNGLIEIFDAWGKGCLAGFQKYKEAKGR